MSNYGPLYDAIMASTPLGYWPMTSVTDVVAGVAGTLVNSPTFTGGPLNADVRNSLSTASQYGAMRIPQSGFPSMVSLELCFELTPPTAYWRGILGLQQPASLPMTGRLLLAVRTSDSALVLGTADGVVTQIPSHNYATLSDRPHHLYIEYIADTNQTAIYIDGSFVLQYAGNQLANAIAGRYITAGGYYYDNATTQGGGYVSDLALYSRRLTAAEIADRVALVGDPTPIHQTTSSPALWGNEQSPASLAPKDPFFASVAPDSCGIRWLAGAITTPPQRSDYGYVTGSVTRKGTVATGQVVACFDSGLNLIDITRSKTDGQFRFDNLPLGSSYSVMALDNDTYTYTPASCDRLTPKEYPWT